MAAECPVCGSMVDETIPTTHAEYEGEEYLFESAKCKDFFRENPEEYA
jgi:YHS domain-containing protein